MTDRFKLDFVEGEPLHFSFSLPLFEGTVFPEGPDDEADATETNTIHPEPDMRSVWVESEREDECGDTYSTAVEIPMWVLRKIVRAADACGHDTDSDVWRGDDD